MLRGRPFTESGEFHHQPPQNDRPAPGVGKPSRNANALDAHQPTQTGTSLQATRGIGMLTRLGRMARQAAILACARESDSNTACRKRLKGFLCRQGTYQ